MKKLAILSLAAIGASANAVLLFNNGPVTNGVGNGFNGANTSSILSGGSNYGPSAAGAANTRVADNFTTNGDWIVNEVRLYAYQTNATSFVFNRARVSINTNDSGAPSATQVASIDTSSITNGGLVGYRVLETNLTASNRAIYEIRITGLNWNLTNATNYWLVFSIWGTSTSVFTPPVADVSNGNAKQSLNNGAWNQIVDATRIQNNLPGNLDLPFQVYGIVPEPGTMIALGAGLAALAARRRRK